MALSGDRGADVAHPPPWRRSRPGTGQSHAPIPRPAPVTTATLPSSMPAIHVPSVHQDASRTRKTCAGWKRVSIMPPEMGHGCWDFLGLGQMGAAICREGWRGATYGCTCFDPNPVAAAPFVLRGAVDQPLARGGGRRAAPIVFACLPHRSRQRTGCCRGGRLPRGCESMSRCPTIGSPAMNRIAQAMTATRYSAGGLPDQRRSQGCAGGYACR